MGNRRSFKILTSSDFFSEWSHVNTLIFGNMAIVKRLYLVTSANRIAMELRTTFTTSRILKVLSSEKKVALLGMLTIHSWRTVDSSFLCQVKICSELLRPLYILYMYLYMHIYAHYILTLPNHYCKEQLWPCLKTCSPVTFQDTERSRPTSPRSSSCLHSSI